MEYTIQIPKAILADIDRAIEWYESKERGLGDKFEGEFKTKIHLIQENPKLFQEIESNQRRAVFGSSFPYTIHYLINDRT